MILKELDIPTRKINQLKNKNINSVEDLVKFFPRKYHDFRNPKKIDNLEHEEFACVVGTVTSYKDKNRKSYIQIKMDDGSMRQLMVVWFNQPYMARFIKNSGRYIVAGKVNISEKYHTIQIANPIIFSWEIDKHKRIIPIYSKIDGMSTDYFEKTMKKAIELVSTNDYFEETLIKKYDIPRLEKAIECIHRPKTKEDIKIATKRFLFEDLFEFAFKMYKETKSNKESTFKYSTDKKVRKLLQDLPFELTEGQTKALRTIYKKMFSQKKIHALVQGDVGAGKTIVAIMSMLLTAENGYQSALMSPTTILAEQHYEEIKERLSPFGIKVDYLSSNLKKKEKTEVLKKLVNGEIDILVGTHSVISEDVEFKNLALTVVDEEHRFGVEQRKRLQEKASENVHHIAMSATPIPRTLALTIHGNDIDVLTIKTLPNGRKPIETVFVTNPKKTYEGIHRQVLKGKQAYIVCPLIEKSQSDRMSDVESVKSAYKEVSNFFKSCKDIKIGLINGKMKQDEISKELLKFSKKNYNILVATTVIEVGVNIPNATVMLIKNAERFGISQLHQLRGRVGRSSFQSYCVLQSKERTEKIEALIESSDGFEMAKKDLEIRGSGNFIGTKQSGENKYIMLMMDNEELYRKIQKDVSIIYKNPNRLSMYKEYL